MNFTLGIRVFKSFCLLYFLALLYKFVGYGCNFFNKEFSTDKVWITIYGTLTARV